MIRTGVTMGRLRTSLAGAGVAGLMLVAGAQPASASISVTADSGLLTISEPAATTQTVNLVRAPPTVTNTVKINTDDTLIIGAGCTATLDGGAECAGIATIIATLGADGDDHDDVLNVNTLGLAGPFTYNVTAFGGGGNDDLEGSEDGDSLDGGPGDDTLSGGDGDDTLHGEAGGDTLNGGDGIDTLFGGNNDDALNGGDGNDALHGGNNSDTLRGEAGDDLLNAQNDQDFLNGGPGDDELNAGPPGSFDTVDMRDETVGVNVDLEAQTLSGPAQGNDTLAGGFEVVFGSSGDDTIAGSDSGNEQLFGGEGNDLIMPRGGDGLALAGWGGVLDPDDTFPDDTISFADAPGPVVVSLVAGSATTGDGTVGFAESDKSHFENIVGGPLADQLTGNAAPNEISGLGGDDEISGGDGDDVLSGGGDDDQLSGDAGDDQLSGDDGEDQLSGEDGEDLLAGGAGNDQLLGGVQNDRLLGEGGNDLISGQAGNDRGVGGSGADRLFGQAGRDVLLGGPGFDRVLGGPGPDLVIGGPGIDALLGGAGNDRLLARDNRRDRVINCGPGRRDRALVDRIPRDPPARRCKLVRKR